MSPNVFIRFPRFERRTRSRYSCWLSHEETSSAPHTEGIGHPVDVIEPRRDQGDLQNPAVVEPHTPQLFMVRRADACRVARELRHVVEHHTLLLGDRGLGVIVL